MDDQTPTNIWNNWKRAKNYMSREGKSFQESTPTEDKTMKVVYTGACVLGLIIKMVNEYTIDKKDLLNRKELNDELGVCFSYGNEDEDEDEHNQNKYKQKRDRINEIQNKFCEIETTHITNHLRDLYFFGNGIPFEVHKTLYMIHPSKEKDYLRAACFLKIDPITGKKEMPCQMGKGYCVKMTQSGYRHRIWRFGMKCFSCFWTDVKKKHNYNLLRDLKSVVTLNPICYEITGKGSFKSQYMLDIKEKHLQIYRNSNGPDQGKFKSSYGVVGPCPDFHPSFLRPKTHRLMVQGKIIELQGDEFNPQIINQRV